MDEQPILRTWAMARTYHRGPNPVPVLRSIDLEVYQGEWVAVIGPSGSGKSTLLNILGLLDHPDAGVYELAGDDVSDLGDSEQATVRNRRIGFVFQSFQLLPRTSALDNVATPLVYRKMPRHERQERARDVLHRVGLKERVEHDASELSGGETQRVAVARALVTDPALVLADEPTGNLDTASGHEILDLFHQIHDDGRTIVMITHDAGIAATADRQLLLDDGRLVPA